MQISNNCCCCCCCCLAARETGVINDQRRAQTDPCPLVIMAGFMEASQTSMRCLEERS